MFAHDCGWNGWNVYAVTGYTRLFPTVEEWERKRGVCEEETAVLAR